jgi:solute carrier family 35 protein E3
MTTVVEIRVADKDTLPWYQPYVIPACLALNVLASISIVLVNKMVYDWYNFKYGTLLTFLHFVFTFLGLEVFQRCGLFEVKKLSIMSVVPLSLSFCGFVVLTNISLQLNTVGFYQLAKVLTTPVIVVIQSMYHGETFPMNIKASLAVTCLGVAIASATDVGLNLPGTVVAAIAVLVTSQYQIWVGTKQKELECNSMQLLYYQAPISAAMLIPAIPMIDSMSTLKAMPSAMGCMAILLSCCLALLVNVSIFLVIGKTSAVTYNVLGHFKLTLILVLGFMLFEYPVDPKNLTGIAITLAGVVWYTHLKTRPKPESSSEKK